MVTFSYILHVGAFHTPHYLATIRMALLYGPKADAFAATAYSPYHHASYREDNSKSFGNSCIRMLQNPVGPS